MLPAQASHSSGFWWLNLFGVSWYTSAFLSPSSWQWDRRMMKIAAVSRCFAVRWQQQTQGEEEVLEPAWLLPQVCWEGAAGSAWM